MAVLRGRRLSYDVSRSMRWMAADGQPADDVRVIASWRGGRCGFMLASDVT
jgi:hypothetical protein